MLTMSYSEAVHCGISVLQGLVEVYCETFDKHGQEQKIREAIFKEVGGLGHEYLLLYEGKKLLGFVSYRPDGRDDHCMVELYHIGARRHTGIPRLGERLVAELVAHTDRYFMKAGYEQGTRMVWLRTALGGPAEQFYRRAGFSPTGAVLPNHWAEGKNETIYQLDVKAWKATHPAWDISSAPHTASQPTS